MPSESSNGRGLYNAALLIHRGRIVARAAKSLLPVYDVFDEEHYFDPAPMIDVIPFRGERLGLHICEDAWTDYTRWSSRRLYDTDPIAILADRGATLFINISASPFNVGKESVRFCLISRHAVRYGVPFVYVNQVGGNDELVFDGRSLCVDEQGRPIAVLPVFRETVQVVDTAIKGNTAT